MAIESAAIQINFKTKRDGMLINLRANDAIELDTLIDGLTQRLAALIDLEQTVENMATPPAQAPAQVIANAFPGAQVVSETPSWAAPAPAPAVAAAVAVAGEEVSARDDEEEDDDDGCCTTISPVLSLAWAMLYMWMWMVVVVEAVVSE